MGEPGWGNTQSLLPESIGQVEGTRGTETSKYPEEKKEKSILLVAASEEGRGQTERLRRFGVEDHQKRNGRRAEYRRKADPERVTGP